MKSDDGYEYGGLPRQNHRKALFAWFLLVTVLTGLGIVWGTRPTTYTKFLKPQFVSYGSLLLCSSYSSSDSKAKDLYVGELEPWLIDPDVFKVYLARSRVLERIFEREGRVQPDLLRQYEWVSITPSFGEVRSSEQVSDGPDFAVLGGYSRRRSGPRPNRISVECFGRTPEESQHLVQSALAIVSQQFVDTATHIATKQKRKLEQLLKAAKLKASRSEKGLEKSLVGLQPNFQVTAQTVATLEARARLVEESLRMVELELAGLRGEQVATTPEMQTLWEANERERVAAAQIYLPDAPGVQTLLERQKLLKATIEHRQSELIAAKEQSLKGKGSQLRRQLLEISAELEQQRKQVPDAKTQLQIGQVSKELENWDAEVISLQKKVLEARIEEQRCKNSAITVVLQEPLPGKRLLRFNATWQERYRLTWKYLPLSFLGGAMAMALIHLLREMKDVHQHVERYCDAPVLADIRTSAGSSLDLPKMRVR